MSVWGQPGCLLLGPHPFLVTRQEGSGGIGWLGCDPAAGTSSAGSQWADKGAGLSRVTGGGGELAAAPGNTWAPREPAERCD